MRAGAAARRPARRAAARWGRARRCALLYRRRSLMRAKRSCENAHAQLTGGAMSAYRTRWRRRTGEKVYGRYASNGGARARAVHRNMPAARRVRRRDMAHRIVRAANAANRRRRAAKAMSAQHIFAYNGSSRRPAPREAPWRVQPRAGGAERGPAGASSARPPARRPPSTMTMAYERRRLMRWRRRCEGRWRRHERRPFPAMSLCVVVA